MKSIHQIQQQLHHYITHFKPPYFSPLPNLPTITQELAELPPQINHHFRKKKKKDTEQDNTIKPEL
ncbi:nucleoside triphosphate pyrophosphohydrolase family protein, partial [Staphylococcus epidermidis]